MSNGTLLSELWYQVWDPRHEVHMEVADQSFPKEQGEQEPYLVLCEGGRRCIGAKKNS
jgi:hypothetical protein